jgi:hypothetical protein
MIPRVLWFLKRLFYINIITIYGIKSLDRPHLFSTNIFNKLLNRIINDLEKEIKLTHDNSSPHP